MVFNHRLSKFDTSQDTKRDTPRMARSIACIALLALAVSQSSAHTSIVDGLQSALSGMSGIQHSYAVITNNPAPGMHLALQGYPLVPALRCSRWAKTS